MNNVVSFVIGLAVGSVVTFFASKKYMQTKFDKELEEEITAFKDSYRVRMNNVVNEKEPEPEEESVKVKELTDEEKMALADKNDLVRYNKMYELKHEREPMNTDIIEEDDPRYPGEKAVNVMELITEGETEKWLRGGYDYEFYDFYPETYKLIDRKGEEVSPECVLGESVTEEVAMMAKGEVCFVRDELNLCLYEVEVH